MSGVEGEDGVVGAGGGGLQVQVSQFPAPGGVEGGPGISGSGNSSGVAVEGMMAEEPAAIEMDGPAKKKLKLEGGTGGPDEVSGQKQFDKLERRLGGILCCAVCLDLPKQAIYQVTFVTPMIPC